MKFSINQSELQDALSVVLKGVSTRSTLPILSGIYIQAQDDFLTLETTDLELSIKYSVSALVEEEGKTVVPGKLFSDIVKNLTDASIQVETEGDTVLITCNTSSFTIKTLDAADFPGFPKVDIQQEIEVPFGQFSSMVKRVARVVSRDESRAILTGVLITLEGSLFQLVATDSYRLAITKTNLETQANDFQAVIAGSFLSEIASLPHTEDVIKLALAENQIIITYRNMVFINRRIEGAFPNYRQLLPDSWNTRIQIKKDDLTNGVKRTSLLGQASSPIKFNITVDSDKSESSTLLLTATTQDVGSAQETISCKGEGEDTDIAFNYAYVLDGLSSIDTNTVFLEVQSSLKPGIFKAEAEEDFLYLVMPVRIS